MYFLTPFLENYYNCGEIEWLYACKEYLIFTNNYTYKTKYVLLGT